MQAIYYHVDAFTDRIFGGNPAGVCQVSSWPTDEIMQKIAAENNLSETAFFVRQANGCYDLRWFTPTVEVDLCGHATLATAHVLWKHEGEGSKTLTFQTKSGPLTVTREENELLALNFPARPARAIEPPVDVLETFAARPIFSGMARDYLFVFDDEERVRNFQPDFARIAAWKTVFAVIVTAPGREVDFVSRFFPTQAGMTEDPVTGSAHCTLIPYWVERLGKTVLRARQVSARGGELFCEMLGERVKIAGRGVTYSRGTIEV